MMPTEKPGVRPENDFREIISAFPASYQQQQLWYLHEMSSKEQPYNIPLAFELHGKMNLDALDQSFQWVVSRHEALRTTITVLGGDLAQVVNDSGDYRLERIDLSHENASVRYLRCREMVLEESKSRFSLNKGPLVKGFVYQLEQERHVLMFNFHHIIVDHLSVLQFSIEFCGAYNAFSEGKLPVLAQPELQYPDFSVWQKEQSETTEFQRDLDDWINSVESAEVAADLPFDHPRSLAQSFAGAEIKFEFTRELSEKIRIFARASRKTAYVTLLTGFKCLLARYIGQADVTVGSPFANRMGEESDGIMGCCMNTLPLRSDLSAAISFSDAMDIVQASVSWAYRRQRVPLGLITNRSNTKHETNRNPYFQNSFMFQDPPMSIDIPGVNIVPWHIHNGTSKFDMAVWMWDSNGLVSGLWEYNTELFNRETIQRLIANFEFFLENAISKPHEKWSQLPIIDKQEVGLLEKWNQTDAPFLEGESIQRLFQEQVNRKPDAIAVVCNGRQLTYKELNSLSNQLGYHLRSLGIGPDTMVGLCLERSIDLIIGAFGILKAGGAYIPMDPSYPKERLGHMVEDSETGVILTQAALAGDLPPHNAKVVRIDSDWETIAGNPTENLPVEEWKSSDLAYVIFTSGSTGRPKGVMVEHRNVSNFFTAMDGAIHPDLSFEDVCRQSGTLLAVTSLSFDISVLELFWTLSRGFTVVLHTENQNGINNIPLLISDHGVTHLQCVPAMAQMMLSDAECAQALRSIKKMMVGGEAFPGHLAEKLREQVGGDVINMYGPTETTVWSSTYPAHGGCDTVPIGRPVANTQFYILDNNRQPVPIGVPGELYIGGAGVARGYLGRDDLTKERFVPNPFSGKPDRVARSNGEDRLYRTGDRVVYRADGVVEYLGRLDFQVKIRGFRIELGEIEAAVNAAAQGSAHSVVNTWMPDRSDVRLVAYLVSKNGCLDISQIREKVSGQLPHYMVPQHFVVLDEFPKTANGKIDRKQLPAPVAESVVDSEEPEGEIENTIAKLWEHRFKAEKVGRKANFFELGGHSLSAVAMSVEIGRAFNIPFPVRKFLENPRLDFVSLAVEKILEGKNPEGSAHVLCDPANHEEHSPIVEMSIASEKREANKWKGFKNRLFQMFALCAPGHTSFRVWLHRERGVKIGENVSIGTGVMLETAFPQLVEIGSNVQLGIRTTFIGHFGDMTGDALGEGRKTIVIEDYVYIGPGVIVLPNVTIGKGAVVTAGSVVNESVPPGMVVQGNPAKPVAKCGEPLAWNSYHIFLNNLQAIDEELLPQTSADDTLSPTHRNRKPKNDQRPL